MSDEIKADTEFEEQVQPILYTVHAFEEDGQRSERAERLAIPRGFVAGEQERAESAARRCNQLGLVGIKFVAVQAESGEPINEGPITDEVPS